MPKIFADRLQGIDVSGANDNCFFHAYAAHLLAGKSSLPQDLFTFQSILGDNSPAGRLQKYVPNQEALSVFANYDRQVRGKESVDANYLVEQTLVLGVLMREWFASKLFKDNLLHQQKEENFLTLVEMTQTNPLPREILLESELGSVYQANEAFIDYCRTRTEKLQTNTPLTQQEQKFEVYFTSPTNEQDALKAYWKEEGYQHYCQQLAQPKTKVAPDEMLPILTAQGQQVSIVRADGNVQHQNTVSTTSDNSLPMTLILSSQEGHYYLATDLKTAAALDGYEQSYLGYLTDRSAVLSGSGHDMKAKIEAASQCDSLLTGAICSVEGVDTISVLIERVQQVHSALEPQSFNSLCTDIELNIHQLLTAPNKQERLAHYHAEVEPMLNVLIKSRETPKNERMVLQEYKQVFHEIEHELNHIMQQEEGLKRRLEFKLHELLDYSERIDYSAKSEVQRTRTVIQNLCDILANPEFDVQKASHFLQEISTKDVSKKYKESYNNIVSGARSCAEEAREEENTPPPTFPSS